MKAKKMIRVISSQPITSQGNLLQDDIKEYIGQEFEVIEWWKNKNSGLEDGEIQVMLRSESDPNPKDQPSTLNKGEYEFI
jgi:hypothetical protein